MVALKQWGEGNARAAGGGGEALTAVGANAAQRQGAATPSRLPAPSGGRGLWGRPPHNPRRQSAATLKAAAKTRNAAAAG